jgi:AcrR family transcriptional regulator
MAVTTRERIVEAGAMLFRRQGWSGTGMKQIAAAAAAPFGSIYHFFPGGKDELSAEVIRTAGRAYGLLIPMFFDAEPDLAIATRNAFRGAAEPMPARSQPWRLRSPAPMSRCAVRRPRSSPPGSMR